MSKIEEFGEEVYSFLEFIGIKGYEARAYLTLLKLGAETAPKLAANAGIPLPRVYDVLKNLVRKGLVEVKAGRPRLYRALPPRIALKNYLQSYIKEISELGEKVAAILEKHYRSIEHVEPNIWLTYSFEASVEKAKELINSMNIDGYGLLRHELFKELRRTLYKKLENKPEILFSLTVDTDTDPDLLRDLIRLDNIMILKQPISLISLIDADHERGVLFAKNYSLFTSEEELMLIFDNAYFYGYWRNAGIIKRFTVRKGGWYKTSHQWMVLPLINDALRQGYKPLLNITGTWVKTGKPAKVTVRAESVYRGLDDYRRTIMGTTLDGKRLSIGGFGATVEDISAKYIEVIIE